MCKYLVLWSCIFVGVAMPISLYHTNSMLSPYFVIAFGSASISAFLWAGLIAFNEMKDCEFKSKSYLEKKKREYGEKYK